MFGDHREMFADLLSFYNKSSGTHPGFVRRCEFHKEVFGDLPWFGGELLAGVHL